MAGYQTKVKLYKLILKRNKNIVTFGFYCWVTKQFIMFYIIIMTTQRILHYKVEIRPPVSRNPSAPKSEVDMVHFNTVIIIMMGRSQKFCWSNLISSLLEADVDTSQCLLSSFLLLYVFVILFLCSPLTRDKWLWKILRERVDEASLGNSSRVPLQWMCLLDRLKTVVVIFKLIFHLCFLFTHKLHQAAEQPF